MLSGSHRLTYNYEMLVNSNNVAQTLKLSIKADFVLLLFGLVMSVLGGPAFAIDYFEITKPKFIPVKVGLIVCKGDHGRGYLSYTPNKNVADLEM